jgi:ribosomal protein S18 acetylase RimI-like enzyme
VIREFEPSDLVGVVQLWRDCQLIRSPNVPSHDVELKIKHDPGLFVAVEKSRVVGSVMAGYEGHRGWINYLAVTPAQQRNGIGARLLQRGEQYLVDLGCEKINLQVRSGNSDVLGFYQRAGYRNDDVVSLGKRLLIPSDE